MKVNPLNTLSFTPSKKESAPVIVGPQATKEIAPKNRRLTITNVTESAYSLSWYLLSLATINVFVFPRLPDASTSVALLQGSVVLFVACAGLAHLAATGNPTIISGATKKESLNNPSSHQQ